MSIMNPLPPQAYTKDTLTKAYAWLQAQSDNIKEMATSQDVLVSLYLKAKLQGDGALERPSIQNFKIELKNLAGMMGEFEVVDPPAQSANGPSAESANSTIRFRSQKMKSTEKPIPQTNPGPSTETQAPPPPMPPPASSSSVTESALPKHDSQRLDLRSLGMIQEVKNQFNLSSDTEAMRLLIAVGYNQVKDLLK